MSTPTTPAKPPRNNTAPEPRVIQPSESDDFGPIIELGPIEPENTPQNVQTTADFNPPANIADQILEDAANPNLPLLAIAQKAGITLSALRRWLARPEISQQLDDIESTLRRRARLKVLHELDNITEACATILERFHRAPDRGSTEDRRPDTELRASSIITRNASNALMASRVLLHLARYLNGPVRPQRAPRDPNPTTPPTPSPAPEPPSSTSHLPPRTSHLPTLRLLPNLDSINLHDYREYLTSNHHHNGHTVEELTRHAGDEALRNPEWTHPSTPGEVANVPRDVAVEGAPQQPVRSANNRTTSPNPAPSPLEPEVLTRNSRGQSNVGRRPTSAAHGKAPDDSPHPATVQRKSPENSGPAPAALPTPCACGPMSCPTCPSTTAILTVAGTTIPRTRDPTAPAR